MDKHITLLTEEQTKAFLSEHPQWTEYAAIFEEKSFYFTRAELVSTGAVGIIDFSAVKFIFYLGTERLVITDISKKTGELMRVMEALSGKHEDNARAESVFVQVLEHLLRNEMQYLQNIEASCYGMEEKLLVKDNDYNPLRQVALFRQDLLKRSFKYQQLADMADTLIENPFDVFTTSQRLSFERVAGKAERLNKQTLVLREYLVQIREMHQQKIDVKHNKTMQVLTVVTTLFFPLTLVAGWYGMNFEYMPELKNKFSYFIVIAICLIIVVGEIIFFKKKKLID